MSENNVLTNMDIESIYNFFKKACLKDFMEYETTTSLRDEDGVSVYIDLPPELVKEFSKDLPDKFYEENDENNKEFKDDIAYIENSLTKTLPELYKSDMVSISRLLNIDDESLNNFIKNKLHNTNYVTIPPEFIPDFTNELRVGIMDILNSSQLTLSYGYSGKSE